MLPHADQTVAPLSRPLAPGAGPEEDIAVLSQQGRPGRGAWRVRRWRGRGGRQSTPATKNQNSLFSRGQKAGEEGPHRELGAVGAAILGVSALEQVVAGVLRQRKKGARRGGTCGRGGPRRRKDPRPAPAPCPVPRRCCEAS